MKPNSRLAINWLALLAIVFSAANNRSVAAQDREKYAAVDLGSAQMIKLVIPQPLASNRLEYDYVFPIAQDLKTRIFIDAKVFAQQRPLLDAATDTSFIKGFGQSTRIGIRRLGSNGNSFKGLSIGYDNLWQQGAYYQQVGAAFEFVQPSYQLVLTVGVPFLPPNFQVADNAPLKSVNLQISVPSGINNLALQPRIYIVSNESIGTAVGGQLQLTYSFAKKWSATIASNYDEISGVSGSLTLQVLLPSRSGEEKDRGEISPDLINGYIGAVGNNGSRIVRLAGTPQASGN